MTDKYLFKIVATYCDPTVPSEIIKETVEEIKILHEEGKIAFNEEAIYDFVHQVKRDKGGRVIECEGVETIHEDEMTEPEDWEAINCSVEEVLE